MNNKKAFTLTELLVALGIIGAIAAISIPSLLKNINNRIMVTELRSITNSIKQLASDQLVINKTHHLKDTDFSDADTLLVKKHFDIVKTCEATDAANDCWKTSAVESEKVKYRSVNNTDAQSYPSAGAGYKTIVLKNGAVISYNKASTGGLLADGVDKMFGIFYIDINGNDPPNIIGRDYFWIYISEKGKVIGLDDANVYTATPLATLISGCKGGRAAHCFGTIVRSGWTMPY